MGSYKMVVGDATCPEIDNDGVIIVHVCNDKGAWGAGFVMALSRKWMEPEEQYRNWYITKRNKWANTEEESEFKLGNVGFTQVEEKILVGNMIAQHGCGYRREAVNTEDYMKHEGIASIIKEIGMPKSSPNSPIDYIALYECLLKVTKLLEQDRENGFRLSVAMPMIGSNLAGGDWNFIEKIIKTTLKDEDVIVYKLKE